MDRRTFLASVASAPLALQAQARRRPNIVLIMADDMGFSDIGCYGGDIATPNLDGMAKRGLRFTQFYNAARCCPSRAALLTGLYNHQAGVGDMIRDDGFPAYRGFLNDKCVTIAEALKPAGYTTYMSGKWHVGEERPHWPTDRGFDRYFGLISGASNFWKLDEGRKMAVDDKPFVPKDDGSFYMTDAFSDHAVQYIREHKGEQSYFLYLAYTAPHWPLHAWPEDIARYKGKYKRGWDAMRKERHERQIEMGLLDPKWKLSPREPGLPAWDELTQEKRDVYEHRMAVYAAQVERMDRGIGQVLQAVRARGEENNTLFLFLSDNGGCHEIVDRGDKGVPAGPKESFLSYGREWANFSNTPFRMYKHWVHEGGISSPLIAYWPGRLRNEGRYDRDVAHITDIMATCLDVGGAKYPTGKTALEGQSLLPAIDGSSRKLRATICWEHEGSRAVRQGRWKLVSRQENFAKDIWELYDMESDRTELSDLAAKNPDRVKAMVRTYEEWARRVGVVPHGELRKARNQRA